MAETKTEEVKNSESIISQVDHRKKPSETDSLELSSKSPRPKSPADDVNIKFSAPNSPAPFVSINESENDVPSPSKIEENKKEETDEKSLIEEKNNEEIQNNESLLKFPQIEENFETQSLTINESPSLQKNFENSPVFDAKSLEKNESRLILSEDLQNFQEIDKENQSFIKNKSIDDSLSLNSSALQSDEEEQVKEEEKREEVIRQRPAKINLRPDSVGSPCGYMNLIVRTEWHVKTVMGVLTKLKEELGGSFLKLIEESTRRDSRSPSRSPSRKITNSGLRTPLVSQRSLNSSILSSFRVEEDNILDIPGYADVFLDRISVKNIDILVSCVAGLITKISYANAQSREIDPIKDTILMQEKAKNMINDSMKATQTEFDQESDNYDVMIKRLKDEISGISFNLESVKKKNELLIHERNTNEKTLTELNNEKEEILKKNNVTVNLEGIKQLKKAYDSLEKGRIDVEEKLISISAQSKSAFETLSQLQNKFIEEKTTALSEIKSITSIIDQVERENNKIKSELQGLSGFLYVDDELKKMLSTHQSNSRLHSQNLDSMRTSLTYLRSNKEDLANDAIALHSKIETETKKVKSSQTL